MKNILITGGAGFIGSHIVRHFLEKYSDYQIYCLDSLTYAGNLDNLSDLQANSNYHFIKADITDEDEVRHLFEQHSFDAVIHAAAESHVDRSILSPNQFLITNVLGTANLLLAARNTWVNSDAEHVFYHISTDEVYGSLGTTGTFSEDTPYDPRSPYSASKASSDHIVRAYFHTYNLPVKISNCSNNYGPNQFPEKLIPLFVQNLLEEKPLPVYGTGKNVRDWVFVKDHVEAIDVVFHKGTLGETYNIGGNNEWSNIALVEKICDLSDELLGRTVGKGRSLIQFVKDRAGHDFRYAIDATKIKQELGWEPRYELNEALSHTIQWYLDNQDWVRRVRTGEYQKYYALNYQNR